MIPNPINPIKIDFRKQIHMYEVCMILHAMNHANGNKTAAARLLTLNRTTLVMKMQRLLPDLINKPNGDVNARSK